MNAMISATGRPAPGGQAPDGEGGRTTLPMRLLALAFFGLATVVYTYPLALHPGTLALPGVGDHPSEAALIGRTAHQLLRAPAHLFDTVFFYPYSHTEAYWQSVLVPGILAIPVMDVTGDALLATNVVVLVALTLSGFAAAGLAWSLTRRAAPSMLAGVVFAYFPNRLEHLNTPIVQMGFLLPVILWAYLRFLEGARWRHLLVLVLAGWGQLFSSLYYAFASGFLLLAVGLGWLLLRPHTLTWRLVTRGALGLTGLALLAGPLLMPYASVHRALGFERPEGEADWFGMDLLSWLDPGSFSTLYHNRLVSLHHSEGGLFPGWLVLLLAAAAVGLVIRSREPEGAGSRTAWMRAGLLVLAGACLLVLVVAMRRSGVTGRLHGLKVRAVDVTLPVHLLPLLAYAWIAIEPRRGPSAMSRRDWLLILGPATLLMFLLTLTPTLTVHDRPRGVTLIHWLFTYLPGMGAFRAPGRWALVFALPLALTAAVALAALSDRLPRRARRAVGVIAVAVVMLECLPLPIPWQASAPLPPAHRWLAQQPGDFAVAVMPADDARLAAWAMLWTTTHWKRLVNGAFVFIPPGVQMLADAETPFDGDALTATLRSIYPLRYVIVARQLLPPEALAAWRGLADKPEPPLSFVGFFGNDDVYAVPGAPQRGAVLRRWFSTDYVRAHPRARYALELSGQGLGVERRVEVRFNDRLLATHEGPAHQTVELAPPYRTGDRNELTFTHVYTLGPAVRETREYRIGGTGVHAPVDITAISAAKPYGNRASIRLNGQELVPDRPRGYVVAAVDPSTGRPLRVDAFDTFASAEEARRMARVIGSLPRGTIVVAVARDEASGQLEETAVRALRSVGAREDLRGRLWTSHALIGVTGARPGDAVEQAGPGLLQVSVGRRTPLEVTLTAFELR